MVNENTVRPAPVAESLRDEFKQAVKNYHGGTRNYYRSEVENALRDRIKVLRDEGASESNVSNEDLLKRLNEIGASPPGGVSQTQADREEPKRSSEVFRKVAAIAAEVRADARERDRPHVDVVVVNRIIREIAGTTDKTVKKYRTLLRERRELYPHPSEQRSAWYTEPEALIVSVEHELSDERVGQVFAGGYYPYDEDWWETHAPDGFFDDDDNREVES